MSHTCFLALMEIYTHEICDLWLGTVYLYRARCAQKRCVPEIYFYYYRNRFGRFVVCATTTTLDTLKSEYSSARILNAFYLIEVRKRENVRSRTYTQR